MDGPIVEYLTRDHRRLEALLDAAERRDPVDPALYAEFRQGLLRHIAVEEKILLPATQEAQDGAPLEIAPRLRLDHGAIAALLVPTPTPSIVATLRRILAGHDVIEEGPDGLYAVCERLLGPRVASVAEAMQQHPRVKMNPHNDAPGVMAAVERALERGGYRLG